MQSGGKLMSCLLAMVARLQNEKLSTMRHNRPCIMNCTENVVVLVLREAAQHTGGDGTVASVVERNLRACSHVM